MFIERMLSLMQEQGVSRRQMAKDVGIGINQIKYWQDNGNVPNALTVEKIADRLNTTPEYLLGKTDEKNKPTEDDGLDEDIAAIAKITEDFTGEELQALLDYANFLISKRKK